MMQTTDEQGERLQRAARSLAAKLDAFRAGLSADEQQMLNLALGAMAATRAGDDVAGYSDQDPDTSLGVRDWCLTWRFPGGLPIGPGGMPMLPRSGVWSPPPA